MSKKDYQAIAGALYRTRQLFPAFSQTFDGDPISAADYLFRELAAVFSADNSRFDRRRFIEACETGKTRGMRQAS